MPFVERTFRLVDSQSRFKALKKDGVKVKKGDVLAKITGSTRSLLMTERVALNLLQRLSGIATLTHKFVECIKGFKTKITDTRKTTPGLRFFEKYAVRVGGGCNHRFGLFDGVLIKDNHIKAVGGVSRAVKLAQKRTHHLSKIEIEVKNIKEVKEALSAGTDIIMLDNMPIDKIKKAVDVIRSQNPHIIIEASGNIKLENVRAIAATGVDLISIGALTYSAPAVDISMEILS
jgi:nicotinate-nucleotide pyrophosphorylase (carboxylating)